MSETNVQLYCICRKPYKAGEFMIQCDICREWFHGRCVKLSEADADIVKNYHCQPCAEANGPSVLRYKKIEQPCDGEESGSLSVGAKRTIALLHRLKQRQYPKESPVVQLRGSEVTVEYFTKHGFVKPIVIPQKEGLDMRVPSSATRLEEIEQLVGGSSTMLDAIDVLEQENRKVPFGEFIRYWNSPSRGGKIYNVISLEVSTTPLGELIEAPRIVRELSWVDRYWPADRLDKALENKASREKHVHLVAEAEKARQSEQKSDASDETLPETSAIADDQSRPLESRESNEQQRQFVVYEEETNAEDTNEKVRLSIDDPNYAVLDRRSRSPRVNFSPGTEADEDDKPIVAKPRVTKYCLMSAKGSFTDFHIDFGGTSVWYHVLRGSKVFYLIEPTEQSTRLYEKWMCTEPNPAQREVFLCDQVRECYRVVLTEGQTVLLPAGWIHAVYTPRDSLVFGGNFLHFFSAAHQVRVYELEKRLHTPPKFMFPNFQTAHWFAASALRDQIFDRVSVREPVAGYLLDAARTISDALRSWINAKQNFKLNRHFIPESFDYRDVLNELEHLITQAKRGFASFAMLTKHKHSRDRTATSSSKQDDDDASHSDDSDVADKRRKRRANKTLAKGKQQPKTQLKTLQSKSQATKNLSAISTVRTVAPSTSYARSVSATRSDSLSRLNVLSASQTEKQTAAKNSTANTKPVVAKKRDSWDDLFQMPVRTVSVKRDSSATGTSFARQTSVAGEKTAKLNEQPSSTKQKLFRQLSDATSSSSFCKAAASSSSAAISGSCGAAAFRAAFDRTPQKVKSNVSAADKATCASIKMYGNAASQTPTMTGATVSDSLHDCFAKEQRSLSVNTTCRKADDSPKSALTSATASTVLNSSLLRLSAQSDVSTDVEMYKANSESGEKRKRPVTKLFVEPETSDSSRLRLQLPDEEDERFGKLMRCERSESSSSSSNSSDSSSTSESDDE